MSGFGAPPAAGGFGKGPGGPGGFGAAPPAAGGFGKAAPPAAGGFGGAPPAAGGFGGAPPAAGGFGKGPGAPPAAGGFGGAPPAAGGFGGAAPPAAGGFGKGPVGGFGATGGFGGATGGFGAPAGAAGKGFGGGFGGAPGAPAAGGPSPVYHVDLSLTDFTRQTTVGRFIAALDAAYNAVHPDCKFRTFVYNMVTTGSSQSVVSAQQYQMQLLGGLLRESQWLMAVKDNPDAERMAPAPVHFMSGLKRRADKQSEMIKRIHVHAKGVAEKLAQLRRLNEANAATQRRLEQKATMLERQVLLVTTKAETLRLRNLPLGDERRLIGDRAVALRAQLSAPGRFRDILAEVAPLVDAAKYSRGKSDSADSGPNLAASVDTDVLRDWTRFLEDMDVGMQKLQAVLVRNAADVERMQAYVVKHGA